MIGSGVSSARNSSGIDRLNINEISLRTDILSVDKEEKKKGKRDFGTRRKVNGAESASAAFFRRRVLS